MNMKHFFFKMVSKLLEIKSKRKYHEISMWEVKRIMKKITIIIFVVAVIEVVVAVVVVMIAVIIAVKIVIGTNQKLNKYLHKLTSAEKKTNGGRND